MLHILLQSTIPLPRICKLFLFVCHISLITCVRWSQLDHSPFLYLQISPESLFSRTSNSSPKSWASIFCGISLYYWFQNPNTMENFVNKWLDIFLLFIDVSDNVFFSVMLIIKLCFALLNFFNFWYFKQDLLPGMIHFQTCFHLPTEKNSILFPLAHLNNQNSCNVSSAYLNNFNMMVVKGFQRRRKRNEQQGQDDLHSGPFLKRRWQSLLGSK